MRIEIAMAHLNCPARDRRHRKRFPAARNAASPCAARLKPLFDFLILDEPTNHFRSRIHRVALAEFLEEFHGTFLVVTHDRYFLDRVVKRMIELSDGKFFSHDGNYTEYLLAKAERQSADATV